MLSRMIAECLNCLGIVADKELMAPGDRPIEIIDGNRLCTLRIWRPTFRAAMSRGSHYVGAAIRRTLRRVRLQ